MDKQAQTFHPGLMTYQSRPEAWIVMRSPTETRSTAELQGELHCMFKQLFKKNPLSWHDVFWRFKKWKKSPKTGPGLWTRNHLESWRTTDMKTQRPGILFHFKFPPFFHTHSDDSGPSPLPSPHPTWPPSYLELLQLLLDHLHLRAHHSLGVQVLFCFSQQALQLVHQSVELLDSAGGFLDLVQSGLASLAQLEHGERKQRLCLFTMEFLKEIQGQNIYNL